jgi:hypothetical protein
MSWTVGALNRSNVAERGATVVVDFRATLADARRSVRFVVWGAAATLVAAVFLWDARTRAMREFAEAGAGQ